MDNWQISMKDKGKKLRVSTYSSDFEGVIETLIFGGEFYEVCLIDTEEIYDFPDNEGALCTSRRKAGRVKIRSDKIHHYEFLDES